MLFRKEEFDGVQILSRFDPDLLASAIEGFARSKILIDLQFGVNSSPGIGGTTFYALVLYKEKT